MVRRDQAWENRAGWYIETTNPLGYDVLINGTDKYLNFNLISWSLGYGFRDNAWVMEFKNSAWAWANFWAWWGSVTIGTPVVGWNPWRILYIDQSGNLFGDDAAVRDSGVQKQTTIGSGTYAQGNANDWVSAEVYFQADNIGDTGNSISLVFDGVDDADTVLNAWNTANPWNTASIVDWLGTTVPTAGTRPFIGWWEIIYESGTVNNWVSTFFQGSGSTLLDTTNSKIWFSTTGNLISVIWEPSLWFAAAGIDFNTGNLWAMVVSDSGINFFVTDQSTYNARLQGDDVEIILAYNGTYLWVNGLSWPLWWDSSSNRYILPTNVTPSVGDTLAVAGISGNDYALDFVTPWGWWVTIGNPVWGGSPNEILFADWSTNVAQSSDLFFDATQKIFRVWDVSSTANDTVFTVNDVTYEIRWTATDWTNTNSIFVNNNGVGFTADEIVSWDWISFSAIPTQGTLVCTDFSSQDQARISVNWSWAAFIQWTNWVTSASWSVFATKASTTISFYDWSAITNWLIVNGTNLRIGNYDASGNSTLLTVDDTNSRITVSKPFWLKGYTVATLPTWFTGATAYVTDATTPTFGATVVWGWAVVMKVRYDGTNWIVW